MIKNSEFTIFEYFVNKLDGLFCDAESLSGEAFRDAIGKYNGKFVYL